MELSTICTRYRARFIASHGKSTTEAQWSALNVTYMDVGNGGVEWNNHRPSWGVTPSNTAR